MKFLEKKEVFSWRNFEQCLVLNFLTASFVRFIRDFYTEPTKILCSLNIKTYGC